MKRPIEADDVVVVPSGRRAVAVGRLEDGRLDFAYINASKPDSNDTVALREDLVRRIEHGMVPPPVRIDANGKRS